MQFAQQYAHLLDDSGRIKLEYIDSFTADIQSTNISLPFTDSLLLGKKQAMLKDPETLGDNHYRFQSGIEYEGELDLSGTRCVSGRIFEEGFEYKGTFLNNKQHGSGRELRKNVTYEGEFVDGYFHG